MRWITLCWQGRVEEVIRSWSDACRDRGIDVEEKLADDDPNKPLVDAVRYLTNNRSRMDYPTYRRLGLPVPRLLFVPFTRRALARRPQPECPSASHRLSRWTRRGSTYAECDRADVQGAVGGGMRRATRSASRAERGGSGGPLRGPGPSHGLSPWSLTTHLEPPLGRRHSRGLPRRGLALLRSAIVGLCLALASARGAALTPTCRTVAARHPPAHPVGPTRRHPGWRGFPHGPWGHWSR